MKGLEMEYALEQEAQIREELRQEEELLLIRARKTIEALEGGTLALGSRGIELALTAIAEIWMAERIHRRRLEL